jgi:hypothetical protein
MDLIVLLLTFAAGIGIGYVLRDWVSQGDDFNSLRNAVKRSKPRVF